MHQEKENTGDNPKGNGLQSVGGAKIEKRGSHYYVNDWETAFASGLEAAFAVGWEQHMEEYWRTIYGEFRYRLGYSTDVIMDILSAFNYDLGEIGKELRDEHDSWNDEQHEYWDELLTAIEDEYLDVDGETD